MLLLASHPYVTSGGYKVCIECGLRNTRPLSAEKYSVTSEEVLALEACFTSHFLPYALSPQPDICSGRKILVPSKPMKQQCRSWDCFFSILARAASWTFKLCAVVSHSLRPAETYTQLCQALQTLQATATAIFGRVENRVCEPICLNSRADQCYRTFNRSYY